MSQKSRIKLSFLDKLHNSILQFLSYRHVKFDNSLSNNRIAFYDSVKIIIFGFVHKLFKVEVMYL